MHAHSVTETGNWPHGFLDAVGNAVVASFGTTWQLEPAPERREDELVAIATVISFSGDYPWSLSLLVTQETAEFVTKSYFGFDIPFASPDMADAVGELVNIVAGECVKRLQDRGIRSQLGLPAVLRGTNVATFNGSNYSSEVRHFRTPAGYLGVGIVGA
jgi:CheY-specific phosphatase CheX